MAARRGSLRSSKKARAKKNARAKAAGKTQSKSGARSKSAGTGKSLSSGSRKRAGATKSAGGALRVSRATPGAGSRTATKSRGAAIARRGAKAARRPAKRGSKQIRKPDPAQTLLKLVEGGASEASNKRASAGPGAAAAARGRAQISLEPAAPGASTEEGGRLDRKAPPPPQMRSPAATTAPETEPLSAGSDATRPADLKLTAAQLGVKQRAISVSEFFTKNRHLLGFDNPAKALLTAVKEAVDNSLDACEEAGVLPEIAVKVKPVAEERFRVAVQDNGPGIVRTQIPRIFGSLLYGSKFHTLKQARGQQGLGISAAGMYGQLTTGKPIAITSRTGPRRPARYYEILIDTKRNTPSVLSEGEVDWDIPHGTRVAIELEATYKKGKHSVDGYLEQTALANPHASILYYPPKGGPIRFERVSNELPKQPLAIKPHPHGVEFGILARMLSDSKARNLRSFLQSEFSRVSAKVADEICETADIKPRTRPSRITGRTAEALYKAIGHVKIMNPPTNCLSPIGEELILRGLRAQIDAEFFTAVTRSPSVYRGNPFLIEAGIAYGGKDLPHDELVNMLRYANRVPLLYQQGACAITKSLVQTSWKNYGLSQPRGALPVGPAVVMVHIASAWVPFTSESKEAIAHYPEIVKEIKLAVQECGRKLNAHIRRRIREAEAEKKKSYIEKYIPHIGVALKEILGLSGSQERKVVETLRDTLERSRKM